MPDAAPAVTAVIPTRNRRDVLAETLGAVLAQRDVDLHLVVVDEGSSDGTPSLLGGLVGERFVVVRHDEARGLAGARNAGLARVSTPWVAFCDDDDLWAPTKLRRQIDAATASPDVAWSCVGAVSIDRHRRVIGYHRPPPSGSLATRLRIGNVVPGGGSGVLARTDLVREVGGFDPTLTQCEDLDMWIRLADASPVASIDEPLLGYRVWPGAMSSNVVRMRRGRAEVMARYRAPHADPAVFREDDLRHRQYLARFHLRAGSRLAGFRDYLDIAREYRLPSHAVHAVGALLAPRISESWRARQELEGVPAAWQADAESWLGEVLPVAPAPADGGS